MVDDEETDYASFEYQQINHEHRNEGQGTGLNSRGKAEYEVLGGAGGLDTNEVAELVYMEVHASLEHEPETESQGVADFSELRGSVGSDLEVSDEVANPDFEIEGSVEETFNISQGDVLIAGQNQSRPEVFQQFRTTAGVLFDNGGTGAGGSSSPDQFYAEKNWRQLTGRGPVLDATDDITVVTSLISGDTNIEIGSQTRIHMVWDVATVDEAGARFSLP